MSRPIETDAKLKPCPFCGNAPDCDNDPVAPRVTCQTRGCAMAWLGVATDKWNTRSTSDLERQRDELAEALRKAKQFAVCNCQPDDDGIVRYHSNCHRHLKTIIEQALATKEGGV